MRANRLPAGVVVTFIICALLFGIGIGISCGVAVSSTTTKERTEVHWVTETRQTAQTAESKALAGCATAIDGLNYTQTRGKVAQGYGQCVYNAERAFGGK